MSNPKHKPLTASDHKRLMSLAVALHSPRARDASVPLQRPTREQRRAADEFDALRDRAIADEMARSGTSYDVAANSVSHALQRAAFESRNPGARPVAA